MDIWHIDETTIHTQNRDLILKNILHVPQATKNLVSIHHFTTDNNVFLKFHNYFFLIKPRGGFFLKGSVTRASILCQHCLQDEFLELASHHSINGIVGLVIL
jgi:hypothetical protein